MSVTVVSCARTLASVSAALLSRMSTPPKRSTVAEIMAATSVSSVRSTRMAAPSPPAALISSATSRARAVVDVGNHDLCAIARECPRDLPTDTAGTPGDDGDFAPHGPGYVPRSSSSVATPPIVGRVVRVESAVDEPGERFRRQLEIRLSVQHRAAEVDGAGQMSVKVLTGSVVRTTIGARPRSAGREATIDQSEVIDHAAWPPGSAPSRPRYQPTRRPSPSRQGDNR